MSDQPTKKTINPNRTPMPEQSPAERVKNFNEVPLGYTPEMAMTEAARCLQCKKPACVKGCPVSVDIPLFIKGIAEGDFRTAARDIKRDNALPAVCGRVCPQETQCEELCILGKKHTPVAIGRLERFIADWEAANGVETPEIKPSNGRKVAVVGAGPAGLTCAGELAKDGYDVTLFEALHQPGGVLVYGIPEFRLPKDIVRREVSFVESLGVNLQKNMVIGKILDLHEVIEMGFEAVFIGTGAGLPMFMNIPGEQLNGVYSANEYLTRINLMKAYKFPEWDTPVKAGKRIAVVGGGNVAMDAARCSLRMPGVDKVSIVYRRSEVEMPARNEEIEHAKQEGVDFQLLTNPIEFIGENGWVKAARLQRNQLSEPDDSGRRRPVPIEGDVYDEPFDTVVIAIGQRPSPLLPLTAPNLKTTRWGTIDTNMNDCSTSIPGVFAGGDVATGAATVILAMGQGKTAAESIRKYLASK